MLKVGYNILLYSVLRVHYWKPVTLSRKFPRVGRCQFGRKAFFRVSPSHLLTISSFLFLEILTTIFLLHLVSILSRLQNDNSCFLQVRTLFVSGLPMDTKPRELYLLFRAYEVQP